MPAAIIPVAVYGGDHGWWTTLWRHRFDASTALLVLALLAMLALSGAWIRHPGRERPGTVMSWLALAVVTIAMLNALQYQRVPGCWVVGTTIGTVVTVLLVTRRVTGRRRELGTTAIESFQGCFEQLGRAWLGRLGGLVRGPHSDVDASAPQETTRHKAIAAGMAAVTLGWGGLSWTTANAAIAVVDRASSGPAEEQRPAPANGSMSSTAPATTTTVPMITTTTVRRGNLRCRYRPGEGGDIPGDVQVAVGLAVKEAQKAFHLCFTGLLIWQAAADMYQQPVFTRDGDGAVLVAWETEGRWVATFVSSDDAAAYQLIDSYLNWSVLGRPLPFIQCDGLWVQPLVGPDNLIVGIGVRDRDDVEGDADRPFYVWGSTVEALLSGGTGLLRLPVGMPIVGALEIVQLFNGTEEAVRSPNAAAEELTLDRLLKHCTP